MTMEWMNRLLQSHPPPIMRRISLGMMLHIRWTKRWVRYDFKECERICQIYSRSCIDFFYPRADPSIRQLVEKLLPIATYYMSVDAFVELHSRFEFGTVSHALCSAIRSLLKVRKVTFLMKA
jgi:Gamma tubulin complex component N-terminal